SEFGNRTGQVFMGLKIAAQSQQITTHAVFVRQEKTGISIGIAAEAVKAKTCPWLRPVREKVSNSTAVIGLYLTGWLDDGFVDDWEWTRHEAVPLFLAGARYQPGYAERNNGYHSGAGLS